MLPGVAGKRGDGALRACVADVKSAVECALHRGGVDRRAIGHEIVRATSHVGPLAAFEVERHQPRHRLEPFFAIDALGEPSRVDAARVLHELDALNGGTEAIWPASQNATARQMQRIETMRTLNSVLRAKQVAAIELDSTQPPQSSTHVLRGLALGTPLVAAALGTALLARRSHKAGWATLGASALAALARWQWGRAFNWQPAYRTEFELGRLEVRRYTPQLRVETELQAAEWKRALQTGFQRLAGYILGDNELEQRLSMTSPVLMSLPGASTKGAEPAPAVTELSRLVGPVTREMALIMPDVYAHELPSPKDHRVWLRSVPARRVAALRFRGRYGGDLPAQKRNELLFLIKCAGLRATSTVWFAGYDAPSTLPLLRRNEVLVEVAD